MNDSNNQDLSLKEKIRQLVENQPFAVLCTKDTTQLHGSLIAFAYSEDLKHYFFLTPKATKKYRLLKKCERIALVIDNRSRNQENESQIEAVTITGTAVELTGEDDIAKAEKMLSERHSYFSKVIPSESAAPFRIDVDEYEYVTRFQKVYQWIP
ncbi:MAG: pyridoxamine 5'-phosphate oxidase family protein [bacterium]